jgi:hypothetical protein
MAKIDNLNDGEMKDVLRRLRALEKQASAGFTSVNRGAFRIASPEGLIVEGSAKVTGELKGEGTLNWTGPVNVSGDDVSITLNGAIPVVLGKIGGFVGLLFGTGARLIGWAGGAALFAPNGQSGLVVTNDAVSVAAGGYNGFSVNGGADGTKILGPVFMPDLPTISGVSANVFVDPDTGKLGVA